MECQITRVARVIDLLMLGTGAMIPLPDKPLSSVLVRSGSRLMLLDCGEGTQTSWRRYHWGFRRLDVICLSHLHADHVAGLPGLFHTISNSGKTDPLTIYGPVDTSLVVQGLRVIAPHLPFEINVVELFDGDEFTTSLGLAGSVRTGDHRVAVLGYRFALARDPAFDPRRARALEVPVEHWSALQAGRAMTIAGRTVWPEEVRGAPRPGLSFAFVTDTRPTPAMRDLTERADLLICEGTYGPDEDGPKALEHKHMTFREAATLARDARVANLWLTHFGASMAYPDAHLSNAVEVFPATRLARQGLHARLAFSQPLQIVESGIVAKTSARQSIDEQC